MKIRCPECDVLLRREGRQYRCERCGLELRLEEDRLDALKERLRTLKNSLKGLSPSELKRVVTDREHPVTAMLIGFAAWGIAYFLRFPIFMAVVLALSFLLGPWGLVLMVVLPLVYRTHRQAIEQQAEKLARERDAKPEDESSQEPNP
jgi:hypothetical protein